MQTFNILNNTLNSYTPLWLISYLMLQLQTFVFSYKTPEILLIFEKNISRPFKVLHFSISSYKTPTFFFFFTNTSLNICNNIERLGRKRFSHSFIITISHFHVWIYIYLKELHAWCTRQHGVFTFQGVPFAICGLIFSAVSYETI